MADYFVVSDTDPLVYEEGYGEDEEESKKEVKIHTIYDLDIVAQKHEHFSPLRYIYCVVGDFGGGVYIKIGQTDRTPLERFSEFKSYDCKNVVPIIICETTFTDKKIEKILSADFSDVYEATKLDPVECGKSKCTELYRYKKGDVVLMNTLYEIFTTKSDNPGFYCNLVYCNFDYEKLVGI